MRKWIRFLISVLIVFIISMSTVYIFSPQLVRWALVQKLPEQWQLASFSMERPSWRQVTINQLKIITDPLSQQILELDGAVIKADWLNLSLNSIEIDRIGGIVSIESIFSTMSPMTLDGSNQPGNKNSVDAFSVPEVFVKQLDVRLNTKDEFIKISGSMQTINRNLIGNIDIATSWNDFLNLNIKQQDKDIGMNGSLNIGSLNYWLMLLKTYGYEKDLISKLVTRELEGNIAGEFFVKLVLLNEEPQSSVWSFSIGDYTLLLDSVDSKLGFAGFAFSGDDVKASNLTLQADVVFKGGRLLVNVGQAQFNLNVLPTIPWLSKSEFNVSSNKLFITYEESELHFLGNLSVDNQKLEFNSKGLFGEGKSSRHSVVISLVDLNESWTPYLKAMSIGQAQGTIEFELVNQRAFWIVSNVKPISWELKEISYQALAEAKLPELKVSMKLPSEMKLNGFGLTELHLNGQGLNIQNKTWNTWSQFDFKSTVRVNPGFWDVGVQVVPTQVDLVSKDLLLTGTEVKPTLNSHLQFYSASQKVQGSLEFNGDIYSIKPLLTKLLPKHKKMIKELIVNNPPNLSSNVNFYYDPSKGIELQGIHSLTAAGVSIGQLFSKSLEVSFYWSEMQPWNRAHVVSAFDLNFGDIDQQQHKVQFDVLFTPELQFKGLDSSSRLFSGEAKVVGGPEFKSWSDSSGEIELENLDLEKISRVLSSKDLSFSGKLSGKIPFLVSNKQLHFADGQLKSEQGTVKYVPGGIKKTLTKDTMSDIAAIALQNFHYHLLTAKLNKGGPCGFDFDIRLEGKNPELGDGTQQNFNIKYQPESNVNLYYLMLLGDSFIKELKRDSLHSACVN